MRAIVLNEYQLRVVLAATETITVRNPAGEIVGFIHPQDRTPPPGEGSGDHP